MPKTILAPYDLADNDEIRNILKWKWKQKNQTKNNQKNKRIKKEQEQLKKQRINSFGKTKYI